MSLFDAVRYRIRALVARRAVQSELDEELRFHLELEEMHGRHEGASSDEARYAALRRLGNRTRVREQVRDASLAASLDPVAQDLRYAVRQLRRSPGFGLVAVLTLALGIGAGTAIFSVVRGVLLRPLPYTQSERLVRLFTTDSLGAGRGQMSPPNVMTLREQRHLFTDVVAFDLQTPTLTGRGDAEKLQGAQVSAGIFEVLGTSPALGRTFLHEENQPGRDEVAVLGHALWQRLFGGGADVIGQTIVLDDVARTIVGVMPPGFDYPTGSQVWTPIEYGEHYHAASTTQRGGNWLWTLGRLQPGVTLERAERELRALGSRLEAEYPASHVNVGFGIVGLRADLVRDVRTPLLLLLGAVGVLLAIVCANVAGLLVARASSRQGELAVRTALGAGRGRLMRQLLVEALVLGGLGGAVGLALAALGTRALVSLRPDGLPRLDGVAVDTGVALFALCVTLVVVFIVGVAPAVHATRGVLAGTLREVGRGREGTRAAARLRDGLVVAELALSVVLLAGAGLLVRSFAELAAVDPGFRSERVATFPVELPRTTYDSAAPIRAFYERLIDGLESVPGVEQAAAVYRLPLASSGIRNSFEVEGWAPASPGERRSLEFRSATPGYFATMGMRIVRGRALSADDRAGVPRAAVLNEAATRRYFAVDDPIGTRLRFRSGMIGEEPFTVVGVVTDVRHYGLARPPEPEVYFAHAQVPLGRMMVVLRAAGDPLLLHPAVRQTVQAIDPGVPVPALRTLEQVVGESIARPRYLAGLMSVFATAALALAAIGVFGLLSYGVARRTREIGVRIALGARPAEVLRLVVSRALALCAAGLAIGIAGALALGPLAEGVLFGVRATDPVTLAGVVLLMAAASLLASVVPASRAVRVDPMVALRSE